MFSLEVMLMYRSSHSLSFHPYLTQGFSENAIYIINNFSEKLLTENVFFIVFKPCFLCGTLRRAS